MTASGRGARRRLRHDVALERRQAARRICEPRLQPIVELVARDHIGVNRALQQTSSAAGRDDNQAGTAGVGADPCVRPRADTWVGPHETSDSAAECLELRDANESRPARGDHLSCGGFSRF
jgi:hypothetical protein